MKSGLMLAKILPIPSLISNINNIKGISKFLDTPKPYTKKSRGNIIVVIEIVKKILRNYFFIIPKPPLTPSINDYFGP